MAVLQKAAQARASQGDGVRRGDGDGVEAFRMRFGEKIGLQCCRVGI